MKIGGYSYPKHSRDHTSSLDKKTLNGKRMTSPLQLENMAGQRRNLPASESKRAHVETYLENLKQSRQQLHELQTKDGALESMQGRLEDYRKMLLDGKNSSLQLKAAVNQGKEELTSLLQKFRPGESEISGVVNELAALFNPEENSDNAYVTSSLESALEHLDKMGKALSKEQEHVQKEIADIMVAMENITASQSLIREEQGADKILKQLKDSIGENIGQSMLSQANLNRNHIMRLIGLDN